METESELRFPSGEAQLLYCLDGLKLLLRELYLQKKSGFSDEHLPDYLKGMVVTPGQVERAFQREAQGFVPEDKSALEQGWEIIHAGAAAQVESRDSILGWLFASVLTSRFQQLCFLLAAAVETHQQFADIVGFLQGNTGEQCPTVRLAVDLTSLTEPVSLQEVTAYLAAGFAWSGIFRVPPKGLKTPLVLRESMLFALLDCTALPTALRPYGRLLAPNLIFQEPTTIRQEVIERICHLERISSDTQTPLAVYLSGETGSGRGYVARELCRRSGRLSLWLNMEALQSADVEVMDELGVCCALNGYIPVMVYQQEVSGEDLSASLQVLGRMGVDFGVIIAQSRSVWEKLSDYLIYNLHFGKLDFAESMAVWENYIQKLPNAQLDVRTLATRYRLMPGQIVNVVRRAILENAGNVVTEETVGAIVRSSFSGQSLRHCRRVEPIFTMEDLILPQDVKAQVLRIIQRVQKEDYVANQWGFGKKYAYGKALGILLYGSPGTGKSMCAHVLAKELGLDLLQVDISSIVSKYIGETEKNLSDLFSQAERTNTILFFDEADALFSKRSTEMSNANDKYANVETAHLLQKMEEFSGICILTTNMAMNFDKAFFRRFEFIINVPLPNAETREMMWRQAFPSECPLDEDLPFGMLAQTLEISPSEIKSIARDAAFSAAMEGCSTIGVHHVQQAVRSDFQKKGKSIPQMFF